MYHLYMIEMRNLWADSYYESDMHQLQFILKVPKVIERNENYASVPVLYGKAMLHTIGYPTHMRPPFSWSLLELSWPDGEGYTNTRILTFISTNFMKIFPNVLLKKK